MALSKEEADFCRMCFCVLDLSGRMFRDILTKKIPVNQCAQVARAIRNLRPEQIAIVNNAAAVGDYRDFDITLAYSFIRNKCPNMPAPSQGWGRKPLLTDTNIADDIERMRILRNEAYGHASAARISAADFSSHMNAFRDICNRMDGPHAIHVSNSSSVPYSQNLQSILNRCMDATIRQQYQSEILKLHLLERQTEHEIKDIKENIERMQLDFDNKILYMRNDRGVIKKRIDDNILRMETHEKQVSSKMKEVKEEIDSVRVKHTKLDEEVHHLRQDMEQMRNTEARLRGLTKERLERHSLYINRQELESTCVSRLEDNASSLCILIGASGQGKTSLGLEIVKRYGDRGFDVFIVHSQDELTLITSFQQPSIVLIDDDSFHPTNKSNSRKFLEDYIRKFNHFPLEQDLKIILILNDYMIAGAKTLLRKCVLFHSRENIINLNEWQMNEGEKRETFLRYLAKYECNVLKWSNTTDDTAKGTVEISTTKTTTTPASSEFKIDIDDIVASDPHYGFPQTCKLFFTNETCFHLGVAFFTDAHTRLCEEISELLLSEEAGEKCQYFLLCAILFHQSLTIDNVQEYAKLLGETGETIGPVPDRMMIERALDILVTHRWLRKHDDQHNHEFCNFSVFVAVLISVGRYFPEVLLRSADDNMIFDFVCSSGYQDFPREVCCHIPEDRHIQLARKLLQYDEMALFHRTLSDETFIPVLLDEMFAKYRWNSDDSEGESEQSITKIFVLVCETDHILPLAKEMVCRLVQNEQRNLEALKEGLFLCVRAGDLPKIRLFEHTSEDLRKEAFIEAIKAQQEDVVSFFRFSLKKIFTESFLISIEYGTPNIFEIIMKGFKFSEENLLDGLLKAVELRREDVVERFVKSIDVSRFIGFTEKIEQMLLSAISSKSFVIFEQMITFFFDHVDFTDALLRHAASEDAAQVFSFLTCLYDKSTLSSSTVEECFLLASRNDNVKIMAIICQEFNTSTISDTAMSEALQWSFSSTSSDLLKELLPLLRRQNLAETKDLFLLATSFCREEHMAILQSELQLTDDILCAAIIKSILNKRPENGRFIMKCFDFKQTKRLQILSQEWFIEFCRSDDEIFVRDVTNFFEKTQILPDSLEKGFLLSTGNKTCDVLRFLVDEFGTSCLTDVALQTVLIEISRCEECSREKMNLLIDKCDEECFSSTTKKECLIESILAQNTDTSLYVLEKLDDSDCDENLTQKALSLSIEKMNYRIVELLTERSGFQNLGDKEKQDLILLAFGTQDQNIIKHILAAVDNANISKESIEGIFLMTIDQRNEPSLSLLLRAFGNQSIPTEIVKHALLRAIEYNNSDIPKVLVKKFQLTVEREVLLSAFVHALDHRNIENIELILSSFGTRVISEKHFRKILKVAEEDLCITRLLVEWFDTERIPREKFEQFVNLAMANNDANTLTLLLEKCSEEQLPQVVDNLLVSSVKSGHTEIIEVIVNKLGKDKISIHAIQECFLIASGADDGNTLEYLTDDKIFGCDLILEETIEKAFLSAAYDTNKRALKILMMRFEKKISPTLKTKGMHLAMDSRSSGAVAEIAKSPSGDWSVGEFFTDILQLAAEGRVKDVVEVAMEISDTCNAAKDKVVEEFMSIFM